MAFSPPQGVARPRSWRTLSVRVACGGNQSLPWLPPRVVPIGWRYGVFGSARTAPVGPTHAVDAATGIVACGLTTDRLQLLDQDWEEAFFVEKCPGCFAAVVQRSPSRDNG
jgi:hypothetical protein